MAAQASLKSEQLLFTPSRSEVPIVSPDFRDLARIVSAGSCDVGGVGGAFIFGSGIAQVRAALFFFFFMFVFVVFNMDPFVSRTEEMARLR